MATNPDNVVREFNALGSNRVRLLRDPRRGALLDIREYLEEADFTGFTRRGVRLDVGQLEQLRDIVSEALALMRSKPDETMRPKAAPAVVYVPTVSEAPRNATAQAAARALRPMVKPQPLNATQRAKAENAVPTSVLPPALQALRLRMRNGETVSPEELAQAMNNWKPKEAPIKPSRPVEDVRAAFNEQTPDGRRVGDSIMDGILADTEARLR